MVASGKREKKVERWVFPDPVFGPTVFSGLEKKLIETAEVNRLQYIKQLSTVYFLYPSADYTRFEHSIGMAKLVRDFTIDVLGEYDLDILRDLVSAAILHDIGHPGWSHAGELFAKYLGIPLEHDKLSQRLVIGDENLTSNFVESGLPLVSEVLKDSEQRTRIANLIGGNPPLIESHWTPTQKEERWAEQTYLGHIISSPYIDFDRVSYLIRDSFYAAGAASFFSLKDVLESLDVEDIPGGTRDLLFESIPFAESFILTRDLMSALIYEDPRNLIAEEMLARAFCLCYQGIEKEEDLLKVWFKTDHEMWEDMRHDPLSRRIAVYTRDRQIYETLYYASFKQIAEVSGEAFAELESLAPNKPQILDKERELIPKTVSPGQVILCIHRTAPEFPNITGSPIWVVDHVELACDVSPLIQSMDTVEHRNHRSFVSLAVDPDISLADKREVLANFRGWLNI
jgi:HD superfamily phosphohydrolase